MTVLVFAEKFDATVDRVVLELGRRSVPVVRCDTSDFPARLSVHAQLTNGRWEGWLTSGFRQYEWLDTPDNPLDALPRQISRRGPGPRPRPPTSWS